LDPPTQPSLFEVIGLAGRAGNDGMFTDLRGDVRDGQALSIALAHARPDVVFHLAAQPLVRLSYAEPALTIETNVMGTVNLLETVRTAGDPGRWPRAVVVVTSDKCYENRESGHAYVEEDGLGGWDPYSASKAGAELVCDAYRRSFFLEAGSPHLATVRAGNVIGGGDWGEERIVPDCVRSVISGRPVEIRNPGAIRPWQHVIEPLAGYLRLGAELLHGASLGADSASPAASAWNFGPGPEAKLTVRELVERFLESWGQGEWLIVGGEDTSPHEAGLLSLDASKAKRELGWRSVWSAADAVDASVAWYRCWNDGGDEEVLVDRMRADVAAYRAAALKMSIPWVS